MSDDSYISYIDCRDTRHHWSACTGFWRTSVGSLCRTLHCERCGAERTDEWLPHGDRLRSRYRYPSGYRVTGKGKVTPKDVRAIVISKVPIYASLDAFLRRDGQ